VPVRDALEELATAFGLLQFTGFTVERGSWRYKWWVRSKEALTHPELTHRLKRLEHAVELQGLSKPQAEVDEKQAVAAARLIEALRGTPNAACQVGSVLVVKSTDAVHGERVVVRTLTVRQMMAIERDDQLLTDPQGLLKRLDAIDKSGDTPAHRTGNVN
jgi:hypothetical protein